jgi:two-component system chemotaxis response regulator CheB
VEVLGGAANGKLAVQKVRELKPDLLTLDLEMPEMDGLAVLDALRETGEDTMVIVVSALTSRGGRLTLQALEKGAIDFITKPGAGGPAENRALIIKELAERLPALEHRRSIRNILKQSRLPANPAAGADVKSTVDLGRTATVMNRIATARKPEMVLIGVSTGGPNALAQLLPAIPGDIGVPILLVQHMPPIFTKSLADSLAAKCSLKVCEASHKTSAAPNTVYIAPGGKQMRLAPGAGGSKIIEITDDPPENNCKPAVDYLFRSAAHRFPGSALAVILTGMGADGTLGLRLLKRNGCHIIAQDEATCVVFGMPRAAIEAGIVDAVLPIGAIASRIVTLVRGV